MQTAIKRGLKSVFGERSLHLTLPNGLGVDYPKSDREEAETTDFPPNELTYIGHQDEFAGTPWHKHVPARVEAATESHGERRLDDGR